ncbi:MAG TPA: hypothetical protein VFK57_25305 [Vicinamibacterales bacterium]|nr:hypothetical protein [Vicinamibacterales bacterium]
MNPDWLTRGAFTDVAVTRPSTMMQIRDALEQQLGGEQRKLRLVYFPPYQTLRHVYWWRQGAERFVEAQFVAELSRIHAVLSLGLSVEKGREEMDARWDWHRFLKQLPVILNHDLPKVARVLRAPIEFRVRSRRDVRGASDAWEIRSFCLADKRWFHRHYGDTTVTKICDYLRELGEREDTWVIVHCVRDYFPDDVKNLNVLEAASTLAAFDGIRQRIRPRTRRGRRT